MVRRAWGLWAQPPFSLLLAVALSVAMTCCALPNPGPGPDPTPPPGPSPQPDPQPQPEPGPGPSPQPTEVVTYATVGQIVPGMPEASLLTMMPFSPTRRTTQDDGTTIYRWPAVNLEGAPRWVDVQVADGVVLGYGLWVRP